LLIEAEAVLAARKSERERQPPGRLAEFLVVRS